MRIKRHAGFTLVEILVVLLIMGITFGMAMLAVGDFGGTHKIRNAAEGFANFLQVAHERAIVESATLQIKVQPSGYTCLRLNTKNQWQPFQHSFYRTHAFPAKTRLIVASGSKKPDELAIIMSSSGDMTPFKIMIGLAEKPNVATVVGREDGTIIFRD